MLESREIRAKMQVVREGCAATDVLARIVRYDGDNREPKWMDVEKGMTFGSVTRFPFLILTT